MSTAVSSGAHLDTTTKPRRCGNSPERGVYAASALAGLRAGVFPNAASVRAVKRGKRRAPVTGVVTRCALSRNDAIQTANERQWTRIRGAEDPAAGPVRRSPFHALI